MKKILLLFHIVLGLSALSSNITRKYHLVKELKTWAEAQSHCRETFTDLAVVYNQDDNDRLQNVMQGLNGNYAWIGLYDDISRWKWSLGNADFNNDIHFSHWKSNEPNNKKSNQICGAMTEKGFWLDAPCMRKFPAVCFYDRGPSTYILVTTEMNWYQAKIYCRTNYTDLVSVKNSSENNKISSLLSAKSWIGLYRRAWTYWSDLSFNNFTNWNNNEHNNSDGNMKLCAAADPTTGKWWDVDCKGRHYFICQKVYSPSSSPPRVQHKTTFKLKFQSEADLNDPAVQHQILEQLHAKLETYGLPDFKLRWIQTDGQTFHKEQKRKKEQGSEG